MKHKWHHRRNGGFTEVTLTVTVGDKVWELRRAVPTAQLGVMYFRCNFYTMMIDDLSRNLGRTFIELPKETDDRS